ncbi:MAG TPA: Calx-beta domain-containing protein [Gemmataceae bacterium]|nr:Calx-beta domain-containing protein [Gemmataceae bacterium]
MSFDNVPPTVTINPQTGQANPAFDAPVVFQVTFNKPVTGFTAADVDLSSSTVGGTLVADVSGSGTDYTISVTGMAGVGVVVAVIAPGAALDAAGNSSAAPTGTNTVNFNSVGQFQFSAANFNTSEGSGTVVISVARINGSDGPVSVNYATSDGSATSGDYSTASGILSWGDGDFSPKTFAVTIAPDDGINEGDETIHLTLSSPTGGAILAAQSTSLVTIAKSSPLGSGASFPDTDRDQVTLKLSGPGTLNYYLSNGTGPIAEIDLAGTDPLKSALSVAVKKVGGDGRVQIEAINETDGTGVKSLALAKADLVGAGIAINGFVGALSIGAIANGADLTLTGSPPKAGMTMKITAGVIADGTDIAIGGAPLSTLTATSVGVGSIVAPSVGTINIKGKSKSSANPAIPGDFKSSLTIAGIGLAPKVPALKLLKVAGSVSGSTIRVGSGTGTNGDVATVMVGSFVNSTLFAGYSGPTDGTGVFNLPSTVGTFTVTGQLKAFAHSFVIATNFGNVSLATVDTDNSGVKFGFLYHTNVKALKVKSTGFTFNPKGTPEQDMQPGDFYLKKV